MQVTFRSRKPTKRPNLADRNGARAEAIANGAARANGDFAASRNKIDDSAT